MAEDRAQRTVDFTELAASGDALFIAGDYRAAEIAYREALDVERSDTGERSAQTAAGYFSLGTVLEVQVRYGEAEAAYRHALTTWAAVDGASSLEVAKADGALASLLRAQGRDREALPLFRRALAIRLTGRTTDWQTALAYEQVGDCLTEMGRLAEAEPLLRKTLQIWQEIDGEVHPATVGAYQSLAANLAAQGRHDAAEPLLRKALDLSRASVGEQHSGTGSLYNDLGILFESRQRYDEAEPLLRSALANRVAALGDRYPATAMSYNVLAENLVAQGRYAEAEPLVARSLAIWRTLLGSGHPALAQGYSIQAASLQNQGRPSEAEPLWRRSLALDLHALGSERPETANAYSALAGNLAAQGKFRLAEHAAAEALAISRRFAVANASWRTPTDGDSPMSLGNQIAVRYLDIAGASFEHDAKHRDAVINKSFLAGQDLISSSAASAMAQAASRVASGDGDLAARVRQQQDLGIREDRIDKDLLAALGAKDNGNASRLREAYDAVAVQRRALAARIDHDFPRYRELAAPRPISIRDAQKLLKPGEGLLVIVQAGNAVQTFAVSRGHAVWHRADAPAPAIRKQISQLRCEVDAATCSSAQVAAEAARPLSSAEKMGFGRFDLEVANRLFESLVGPVMPALSGVQRLYVVTSGALGDLPLGLLTRSPPPPGADLADPTVLLAADWLSDRFAITSLPAASGLRLNAYPRPRAISDDSFRGYGDPALAGTTLPLRDAGYQNGFTDGGAPLADASALKTLAPLPGTRVELTAMARLFGNAAATLVLGQDDTEERFRHDPLVRTARTLAFATHGLLPNVRFGTAEPGLVFTLPVRPSDGDDGILTASEAAELSLSADLVILSACSTASTESGAGGGDSLSALARGFLYAGARSLLASHWRVSDEATSVLTVETLVARRSPGVTRAQALQLAMRIVRTGRRADGSPVVGWTLAWAHPAAWAPFSHIANHDE